MGTRPLRRPPVSSSGRSERLVGRFAIVGLIVGALLGFHLALHADGHLDVLWIALIAASILTAELAGFVVSAIAVFAAAILIDIWLLEPRGSLLLSSSQDALTLVLFVLVSLTSAAAVSGRRGQSQGSRLDWIVAVDQPDPLLDPLTDREREILAMLGRGMSNREIARELVVSPNTVKTHLEHLYGKLDVPSRGRAVAQGRRLGIIVEADD